MNCKGKKCTTYIYEQNVFLIILNMLHLSILFYFIMYLIEFFYVHKKMNWTSSKIYFFRGTSFLNCPMLYINYRSNDNQSNESKRNHLHSNSLFNNNLKYQKKNWDTSKYIDCGSCIAFELNMRAFTVHTKGYRYVYYVHI